MCSLRLSRASPLPVPHMLFWPGPLFTAFSAGGLAQACGFSSHPCWRPHVPIATSRIFDLQPLCQLPHPCVPQTPGASCVQSSVDCLFPLCPLTPNKTCFSYPPHHSPLTWWHYHPLNLQVILAYPSSLSPEFNQPLVSYLLLIFLSSLSSLLSPKWSSTISTHPYLLFSIFYLEPSW